MKIELRDIPVSHTTSVLQDADWKLLASRFDGPLLGLSQHLEWSFFLQLRSFSLLLSHAHMFQVGPLMDSGSKMIHRSLSELTVMYVARA